MLNLQVDQIKLDMKKAKAAVGVDLASILARHMAVVMSDDDDSDEEDDWD